MKTTHKITAIAALGAVSVLLIASANRMRSETVVQGLTQGQSHSEEVAIQDKDRPQTISKLNRFAELWRARHEQKVDDAIIPYLKDPQASLRVRAARALGRTGDSQQSDEALEAMLQRIKTDASSGKPSAVREQTVELALARLRSRDLKGKARVAALVKSVGLTLGDLSLLTQKINGAERAWTIGSRGDEIVEEVVDVLYVMGKNGENAEALANKLKLKLTEPQHIKLQGAMLNQDKEIDLILDYLEKSGLSTPDHLSLVRNHFTNLGPRALTRLMQRLQEMRQRDIQSGATHSSLVRILTYMEDPRALPLLRELEEIPNSPVHLEVKNARMSIEAGLPPTVGP